jgi:hypothetical protein
MLASSGHFAGVRAMLLPPGSLGFVVLLGALTALNALAIDMSLPALPEL